MCRRMKLGIKRGFGVSERDYIVMEDKVMILNWGFVLSLFLLTRPLE